MSTNTISKASLLSRPRACGKERYPQPMSASIDVAEHVPGFYCLMRPLLAFSLVRHNAQQTAPLTYSNHALISSFLCLLVVCYLASS